MAQGPRKVQVQDPKAVRKRHNDRVKQFLYDRAMIGKKHNETYIRYNRTSADIDPFNAPVPGQSLTDTPGNYPWEHPPKNTDVEMLLENLFTRLTQPQSVKKL